MEKTNKEAIKIEHEVYNHLINAMDLLDHIHAWGDETVDRDKLWEQRARVQDAIRALNDLKPLRKLA